MSSGSSRKMLDLLLSLDSEMDLGRRNPGTFRSRLKNSLYALSETLGGKIPVFMAYTGLYGEIKQITINEIPWKLKRNAAGFLKQNADPLKRFDYPDFICSNLHLEGRLLGIVGAKEIKTKKKIIIQALKIFSEKIDTDLLEYLEREEKDLVLKLIDRLDAVLDLQISLQERARRSLAVLRKALRLKSAHLFY
ncbi:MAG: hypothetical protein J7M18_04255, partial [Candidatus Eremiobacteraeota bacterium]|nr:hypothetical protein [Candidatus Eremiobacteraeota bacterium]